TGQELQHFGRAARAAVRLVMNPRFGALPGAGEEPPAQAEVETASESLSAALYFISTNSSAAPATGHLVTIDMGGLTSDVSIWIGGRMIWRNSLKLAGRDIAISFFTQGGNFEVLRDICADDGELRSMIDSIKRRQLTAEGKDRHAIEIVMNNPR